MHEFCEGDYAPMMSAKWSRALVPTSQRSCPASEVLLALIPLSTHACKYILGAPCVPTIEDVPDLG